MERDTKLQVKIITELMAGYWVKFSAIDTAGR